MEMVRPKQASVTPLYCFVRSTYRPKRIPPNMMATCDTSSHARTRRERVGTWKPAPISSMMASRTKPALCMVSEVNAETTLVTPIEATKAASGGKKPCRQCQEEAHASLLPWTQHE